MIELHSCAVQFAKVAPVLVVAHSIGVIQTFVGHISARMVSHYTHISSGAARKAVEMLDSQPILVPSLTAAGAERIESSGLIQ